MNALCIELILSGPRKINLHPELGSSDPLGHLLNFGALNSNIKSLLSTESYCPPYFGSGSSLPKPIELVILSRVY